MGSYIDAGVALAAREGEGVVIPGSEVSMPFLVSAIFCTTFLAVLPTLISAALVGCVCPLPCVVC